MTHTHATLNFAERLVELALLFLELFQSVVLRARDAVHTREVTGDVGVTMLIVRASLLNSNFTIIALDDDLEKEQEKMRLAISGLQDPLKLTLLPSRQRTGSLPVQ